MSSTSLLSLFLDSGLAAAAGALNSAGLSGSGADGNIGDIGSGCRDGGGEEMDIPGETPIGLGPIAAGGRPGG